MGEHPDGAIGFEIGLTVIQQNVGLKVDRIQSQVPEQRLTQGSLGSRETESAASVLSQYEPGETRAEHAVPIKNDDRTIIRERRNGRVLPVTEWFSS